LLFGCFLAKNGHFGAGSIPAHKRVFDMVAIKSGVQNEKGVVLASPAVLGTFDATATIFRKKRCGERV
jgi:hypothetical protein